MPIVVSIQLFNIDKSKLIHCQAKTNFRSNDYVRSNLIKKRKKKKTDYFKSTKEFTAHVYAAASSVWNLLKLHAPMSECEFSEISSRIYF